MKAGDQLLAADKSKLPVENVSKTGDTETVYNFRVADWHTYFVGKEDWDFEVWVHNACGPINQPPKVTRPAIETSLPERVTKELPPGQIRTPIEVKQSRNFFEEIGILLESGTNSEQVRLGPRNSHITNIHDQ